MLALDWEGAPLEQRFEFLLFVVFDLCFFDFLINY